MNYLFILDLLVSDGRFSLPYVLLDGIIVTVFCQQITYSRGEGVIGSIISPFTTSSVEEAAPLLFYSIAPCNRSIMHEMAWTRSNVSSEAFFNTFSLPLIVVDCEIGSPLTTYGIPLYYLNWSGPTRIYA